LKSFSIAGKRGGFDDARGTLFFEIARIIKYHKPKVVFLENVDNLARHDNGRTLEVILNTLHELGYDVHYKVLNAADYGVAQRRKRIYFVCFLNGTAPAFHFPEPLESDIAIEDFLDTNVDEHYYLNEPDIKLHKADTTTRVHDTYLLGYIGQEGQGRRIYSIKGLSPTTVVSSRGPAGGTEAIYINGRIRRLTPNEVRRILGFPDDFVFTGTKTQQSRQVGNAVPVNLAYEIGLEIHKSLEGVK